MSARANRTNGFIALDHQGVEVRAEWDGGEPLTLDEFVRTSDALVALWAVISGKPTEHVPAAVLTYQPNTQPKEPAK